MASLSVIITTHNCAPVVAKTLQSVGEAQAVFHRHDFRWKDVATEVVVVDDGSTDDTCQVVLDFARDRPDWRLVRRAKASSPSCARNTGVREAQGELLFFLDGDDLYLPQHLAQCYALFEDPHVGFVKTGVRLADPVHADWKTRIEDSIVINLCVRRSCHDFIGGYPDYHLARRIDDRLKAETDIFFKIEDMHYNRLVRAFFQGRKIHQETVEYCRYPGNAYDRQYEKFSRPSGTVPEVYEGDQRLRLLLAEVLVNDLIEILRNRPIAPDDAVARLLRPPSLDAARKHHQAGDVVRAEQIYRQVLSADPSDAQVWYLLGAACHAAGKLGDALTALQQAIQRQPQHADAHNHLGVVLAQQGRHAEAVASFRQSLQLKPDADETARNLGLALKELGRLDEAADSFRLVLRLRPDDVRGHFLLGQTLAAQGKRDEAAACYQQAIRLQPGFTEARDRLKQLRP
jgi:tetratricopeptide (TPR) repeat protein